jgi:HD-GYP domain-containing protein (c-di-GMP phosphodiesterase class II)
MRARLHYLSAAVILALYGARVCPFLDTLSPAQLALPIAGALLVQFGARGPAWRRAVETASDKTKGVRAFFVEFGLFLLSGLGLAVYNRLVHGFPAESGIKVVLGFVTVGYFAAVDLALERERRLARDLQASGRHLELDERFFPLSAKLALFASLCAGYVAMVFFLVVVKDLDWLSQVGRTVSFRDAQVSILKEVTFIAAVILAHVINVIVSYSKNLRVFLDNQSRVLAAATAGRLDGAVPVSSNDEFGLIAKHTNAMIRSLRERNAQLQLTQDVTILTLASLAETRDNETGAHILRTQRYLRALAEYLGDHPRFRRDLGGRNIELLYKSAPLHDIGKVGIPDRILLKPGRLTEEEFAIMKTHAALGGEALRAAEAQLGSTSFLRFAREIALSHHEKWDGSGYPAGLKGDAIPVSGRLMALADVYDALISKRVYKPAFSHDKARQVIIEGRGSHFDPDVVDAFLAVEADFRRIAAEFSDEAYAYGATAERTAAA